MTNLNLNDLELGVLLSILVSIDLDEVLSPEGAVVFSGLLDKIEEAV